MKRFYSFLSVLIIPLALILYSHSSGSIGGKTGSVGDGGTTCTQCHSDFNAQAQAGWITTNIPAEGYTPGETYTITATGTHDGVQKFGFELTAEDNIGTKRGTLTITDATRTKLTNGNKAVTHTQAGNTPSGNSNTWSMDWTAPAASFETIIFNAAYNAANGNGKTGGDKIYTSSLSVSEYIPVPAITSVEPDHAEQGWSGTIAIEGENTAWEDGVTTIMFKYHDDNLITFSASNIQVGSDNELTCDVSILLDQMIGEYDVMVDALVLDMAFTVDVVSGIGDDHLASLVNVFPNPARDFVNIDTPDGSEIRIVDMLGHELLRNEATNNNERLDVSGFESGIYFIQVIHEGNAATMRFMKN